jgi:hypothetical protein
MFAFYLLINQSTFYEQADVKDVSFVKQCFYFSSFEMTE